MARRQQPYSDERADGRANLAMRHDLLCLSVGQHQRCVVQHDWKSTVYHAQIITEQETRKGGKCHQHGEHNQMSKIERRMTRRQGDAGGMEDVGDSACCVLAPEKPNARDKCRACVAKVGDRTLEMS